MSSYKINEPQYNLNIHRHTHTPYDNLHNFNRNLLFGIMFSCASSLASFPASNTLLYIPFCRIMSAKWLLLIAPQLIVYFMIKKFSLLPKRVVLLLFYFYFIFVCVWFSRLIFTVLLLLTSRDVFFFFVR